MADEQAELTTTTTTTTTTATWLNELILGGELLHNNNIEESSSSPLQLSNNPFEITSITHFLLSDNPQWLSLPTITARVGLFDKGIINSNKYTLKLNGLAAADDGYKWRKYGQKSIKNSPFPRSYYKCTNQKCSAKKQVERSREEEDTFIITYEGLHLHFPLTTDENNDGEFPPPAKKPRTEAHNKDTNKQQDQEECAGADSSSSGCSSAPDADSNSQRECDGILLIRDDDDAPQGLLEDLVPLAIRNPALAAGARTPSPCKSHLSSSAVSSSSSLSLSSSLEYN
ncbi:Probable WRKY transcription factor 49 [Linum grandiflorum]